MIVSEIKVKHIKNHKTVQILGNFELLYFVYQSSWRWCGPQKKKLSKLSHGIQGCDKIEQTMIAEPEICFGMPALG